METHVQVDRAMDSGLRMLNSHCHACVKVPVKFLIPWCLHIPTSDTYWEVGVEFEKQQQQQKETNKQQQQQQQNVAMRHIHLILTQKMGFFKTVGLNIFYSWQNLKKDWADYFYISDGNY